MKWMKKQLLLLLFIMVLTIICSIPAFASTAFTATKYKDGIGVELTPDQMAYSTNNQADVVIKVTNYNDYTVNNVSIQGLLPDGLNLADTGNATKTVAALAPGDSLSLDLKLNQAKPASNSSEVVSSQPSNSSSSKGTGAQTVSSSTTSTSSVNSGMVSSSSSSSPTEVTNPHTGTAQYILASVLSVVALIAVILLFRFIRRGNGPNHKNRSEKKRHALLKGISVLLVTAMLLPFLTNLRTLAESASSGSIPISQTVTFGGNSYNISATITYDQESSSQSGSTTYTRGQWIDLLLKKLGYDPNATDANNSTQNDYYADSSGSTYGRDIEFAHAMGILPAPDNEGYVDPDQDVPLFEPDKTVTREFAAYTVVTAMGFTGTYALTSSDASSAKYPSQDAVAVQQGFLSLQGDQFKPDQALNLQDKNSIFAAINYINASTKVDTDKTVQHITYAQGVVVDPLANVTNYTVSDNGDGTYKVVFPAGTATSVLAASTVFVLPANTAFPSGIALKVKQVVSSNAASVTLLCTAPDSSEVLDQMQYSGAAPASPADFQADSGVTARYDSNGTADTSGLSQNGFAAGSEVSQALSGSSNNQESLTENGTASTSITTSDTGTVGSSRFDFANQEKSFTSKETPSQSTNSGKKTSESSVASSTKMSFGTVSADSGTGASSQTSVSTAGTDSSSASAPSVQANKLIKLGDINAGGSVSVPGTLSLSFDKDITSKLKVSGSIKMSIPDVTCRANLDLNPFSSNHVKDLLVSVSKKVNYEGELKYTIGSSEYTTLDELGSIEKKEGKIELGRLPIELGATGLSVDLVLYCSYSAEGSLSVTYTIKDTQGIQVINGAFRTIHNSSQSLDELKLDGTAKAGVALGVTLTAFHFFDLIGVDGDIGAGFTASFTAHTDVTPVLYCADATLYLYLTIELNDQTIVGDILKNTCHISWSWDIWNEENSPLKQSFHVENGKIVPECTYGDGDISGLIKSAEGQTPLPNARILVYDGDALVKTAYSNSQGQYKVTGLTAGNYDLKISETGRYTFTTTATVTAGHVIYIETLLMVNRGDSSSGAVSGRIIDAVSGSNISNATYTVFKGWNNTTTNQVKAGTSQDGTFVISLSPGNYTIQFAKDGYTVNSINIAVVAGMQTAKDVTLSPSTVIPANGTIRIVLTWGETPMDLDSHLFGPTVDGTSEFHTAYYQKDYYDGSTQIANLDLDDTTSYGPETTTIYQLNSSGTYKFYVHDYSDMSSTSSTALSQSGAQVKVYSNNVLVAEYNVPTGQAGTLWHVFNFDATSHRLTPVNTFSYSQTSGFDDN